MTTAGTSQTGTVLDRILERTASDLAVRVRATPLRELELVAATRTAVPSLRSALEGERLSVIAEVKRASPSKGTFPVQVEPASLVGEYLEGEADAISCLTDEPFFEGSLDDLNVVAALAHEAKAAVPVLRKDFIIDPYQIVEAKAHGADAILLIAAALTTARMKELYGVAESLGLEAIVEVHDAIEVERALEIGARIVGINNRDLRTLRVDLAVTEGLAPLIPSGTIVVGESGIATAADAARMARAGVQAILVGEALILQPDRAAALRQLRGAS
ncbi:MAG: indole-3-glycerol phosphate synthase TrpC [Chloroflexota bacterium]|nr:indole-3-glycerol phosphate synthase TrpC [Chloroflexota bacterium]